MQPIFYMLYYHWKKYPHGYFFVSREKKISQVWLTDRRGLDTTSTQSGRESIVTENLRQIEGWKRFVDLIFLPLYRPVLAFNDRLEEISRGLLDPTMITDLIGEHAVLARTYTSD